jgi:hypothetical protein
MEVERFKRVVITNSYIVDFLSVNTDNKELLQSCETMLESFCKATSHFMQNYSKEEDTKKDSNKMFEYLKDFQKTLDENFKDIRSSMGAAVDNRVSGQLSGLYSAITLATERLNIDNITNSVSNSLKQWSGTAMPEIAEEIKAHIMIYMTEPQNRIMQQLVSLPDILNNKLDNRIGMVQTELGQILQGLGKVERDIDNSVKQTLEKYHTLHNLTNVEQQHVKEQMQSIPLLTKSLIRDVLGQMEQETHSVLVTMNLAQQQLAKVGEELRDNATAIGSLKGVAESLAEQVDSLDRRLLQAHAKQDTQTTGQKGKEGEDRLCELLSEKLLMRDGYVIERVSGQAHSCDIVVKREGYPPVRIESKAHREKVRHREVERFQSDLMQLNNHGIFVSLYNGIVGVGNLEIQQLPNGKFAVYVSNNNYDADEIIAMIMLVYRLDRIVEEHSNKSNMILSTETLNRLRSFMKDYNLKIQMVKKHMKDSIALLSEIQMDMLEKMITGYDCDAAAGAKEEPRDVVLYECEWCNASYAKKTSLASHKRVCKSRPGV